MLSDVDTRARAPLGHWVVAQLVGPALCVLCAGVVPGASAGAGWAPVAPDREASHVLTREPGFIGTTLPADLPGDGESAGPPPLASFAAVLPPSPRVPGLQFAPDVPLAVASPLLGGRGERAPPSLVPGPAL